MRGTAHLHICMQAAQCSLAHLSTGFLIWACVLQLWSHGLVCRPALSWLPVQAPRQRMFRRRLAGTSGPMRVLACSGDVRRLSMALFCLVCRRAGDAGGEEVAAHGAGHLLPVARSSSPSRSALVRVGPRAQVRRIQGYCRVSRFSHTRMLLQKGNQLAHLPPSIGGQHCRRGLFI